MTALKTRIRVIKGTDLYDQATKMCLVPNMVVPKICVPEFIKYIGILNILGHNALQLSKIIL